MAFGLGHEERDTVSELNSFLPPVNIVEEVGCEDGGLHEPRREPLGGQASVEEEPASKNDIRTVKEFAAKDSQFPLRGSLFGRPGEEDCGNVFNFVLGEFHDITVGVIKDAKTLTNCAGRRDVSRGLGQT